MSGQPTPQQGYEASGNNATKDPAEQAQSARNASAAEEGHTTNTLDSSSHANAEPASTSLGRGIEGAPAGEEGKGRTEESVGRHNELDGEQMAAPGEGKVAAAVANKPGASGGEQGMESDLDKKKKEQAPLRAENKEKRKSGVDVGGVLGQSGGPANPVD